MYESDPAEPAPEPAPEPQPEPEPEPESSPAHSFSDIEAANKADAERLAKESE